MNTRNARDDSVELLVDYFFDKAVGTEVEQLQILYEIVILLIKWHTNRMPDNFNDYFPVWVNLYSDIDSRMNKTLMWLKWNKPEVANKIQEDYFSLLECGWGEKWKDGERGDIVSGIKETQGCAMVLFDKLKHMAEFIEHDENDKPRAQKIQSQLNLSIEKPAPSKKLLIDSLLNDFQNAKIIRTNIPQDFIELLDQKIELAIKHNATNECDKTILTNAFKSFKESVDNFHRQKLKSSHEIEDITILSSMSYASKVFLDIIIQCLQNISDAFSSSTHHCCDENIISVDLRDFQKQTGGHINLLRDFEQDLPGKEIPLNTERHGKHGIRTLKDSLREKGYEDLAINIRQRKVGRGYKVKCDVRIKLIE